MPCIFMCLVRWLFWVKLFWQVEQVNLGPWGFEEGAPAALRTSRVLGGALGLGFLAWTSRWVFRCDFWVKTAEHWGQYSFFLVLSLKCESM